MDDIGHGMLHWLALTAQRAWVYPALLATAQNQYDARAQHPEIGLANPGNNDPQLNDIDLNNENESPSDGEQGQN